MTARERFLAILDYRPPDAPLLMQWMGFSDAVLARWRREGLPAEADPYAYFGLAQARSVPVTVFPYPPRADIELERAGTRRIVLDNRDLRVLHDEAAPYFPKYTGHPVQSRADWERYAARLNTGDEARYDALREAAAALRASDRPVVLGLRGCWEIRYFLGMTEALVMLHDDAGFVVEMLDRWFAHQWQIVDRVCEHVVPDAVCLWEDLAYKNGPFISPAMYRRFFARYHAETARRLRSHGIRHFLVDCDGNIDSLLPLFLENGITGTYPLECQSEADPVKFRRQYGRRVQLIGGIDKRALIRGREATRAEVEHKLSSLVAESGYLPGTDHAVPPEVSLETFRYYVDHLRETWEELL
jgi:uroporphyrinogen-III decarboxylase